MIAALGAVTERLRFVTFVVKLPIRHPVLGRRSRLDRRGAARQPALLRVGTSPWPEDYEIIGVPWAGAAADGRMHRRSYGA